MATYKVIQDIEAEDKLLGPFSLRQFIYLIIVSLCLFIGYRLVLSAWFLAVPLIPFIIFFGLLAAPLGGSQSSEVWLLARIRFIIKPKKRIWDQSGIKDLVTITAPKQIQQVLTNNLSQAEVRSRLEALANTIDSRGWAVKNVNVNLFTQPAYATPAADASDRLVTPSAPLQNEAASDIQAADDIFENNNRTAQYLDQMISASSKAHRDQLVAQMQQASQNPTAQTPATGQSPPPDYWFMNPSAGPVIRPQTPPPDTGTTFQQSTVVTPSSPAAPVASPPTPPLPLTEEQLMERIHAKRQHQPQSFNHMRVIKPMSEQQATAPASAPQPAPVAPTLPTPVTPPPNPAILELANNDDLNVATIARQANKARKEEQGSDGEVVISLH